MPLRFLWLAALALLTLTGAAQSRPTPPTAPPEPQHGTRPGTLVIRDVHVVRGPGTPVIGPTDVVVSDGRIVAVGRYRGRPRATAFLDGERGFLLPGFVNMHGHWHLDRMGEPMPPEYVSKLWLAAGITTVRDLGSDFRRVGQLLERAERGEIVAPRVLRYAFFGSTPPDLLAQRIRQAHERGADGLKFWCLQKAELERGMMMARSLRLRTTTHMGLEDCDARDVARLGLTSIEHWYGIPDAALDGVQRFPADYSYSNEVDRFRWAGRLWREAQPDRLEKVLRELVEAEVAWDPTLAIYEASRDVMRAQSKPWFRDYLHPALEDFFLPNLDSHGSYFMGWTSADEAAWKENYRLWMRAVRRFASLGGVVTCGEDAGYIHLLYGFGFIRELELHQEAGFHPLDVIKHATWNAARVLGMAEEIGRVEPGWSADLVLVKANPLRNLKVLYPTGTILMEDGKPVRGGGIAWTIKQGWCYHGPTLLKEVATMVREARERREEREGK